MRKARWWRRSQSRIKISPGYSAAMRRHGGCSGWRAYPARARLRYQRKQNLSEEAAQERNSRPDMDNLIADAVRRNSKKELKEAFIQLIYSLPDDEEQQCEISPPGDAQNGIYAAGHIRAYGDMKEKFRNYYYNLENLNAAKAGGRLLPDPVRCDRGEREGSEKDETRYFRRIYIGGSGLHRGTSSRKKIFLLFP